jgi:hypothetical protein
MMLSPGSSSRLSRARLECRWFYKHDASDESGNGLGICAVSRTRAALDEVDVRSGDAASSLLETMRSPDHLSTIT